MTDAASASHVVIVGGGVAAVETLLALRAAPRGAALSITLVAPGTVFDYRPLAVLTSFGPTPLRRYPLRRICDDSAATLVADTVVEVDAARRAVRLGSGATLAYDALVLAPGARTAPGVAGSHTFLAETDGDGMRWVLDELDRGEIRSIAFVVPAESGWSLPLYELALLTAAHCRAGEAGTCALTLVTHESEPLAVVGGDAGAAVAQLLDAAEVRVVAGRQVRAWEDGRLALDPAVQDELRVDRVVSLPRQSGPGIAGLPTDESDFIEVDDHMRVPGMTGVYAVGDATTFPVKQGGLASQQADLAASLIARAAGPDPSAWARLRSVLLTGERPLYIQALIENGKARASSVSEHPPWSPPQKIAARYLAPYLDAWDQRS